MTTFDEVMMKRALKEAADDFAVSDGAVERILDQARASAEADDLPRVRAFIRRNGPVRTSLMAAAACVVVLAVAVPLFNVEGPAPKFNAINKVHGEAYPTNAKTLSGATSDTNLSVVQGTSYTATPEFGAIANTSATSASNSKSSRNAAADALDGSLRVEETGFIDLTVGGARFQATLTQLTDMATTDGGFVASTQSHIGAKATHTYSTGTVVLQVPEKNFTMLVDQVRHAGTATSVNTSATDVTGQYVDLQARISALQVSREQYLKIMARTNSIGGILAVQDQLNTIQSQIEQLQAQLGLLNSETTYATLTVSLSEAGHAVTAPHRGNGVDKAWHDSLHGFAAGVEWLIRIAGPLLFALLLLSALLALGRWAWRATERRRHGIG